MERRRGKTNKKKLTAQRRNNLVHLHLTPVSMFLKRRGRYQSASVNPRPIVPRTERQWALPSATYWLKGRKAPEEKEELQLPLPETAIECLAACAPAAKMGVQSVDMRLPTASLHRFRFSWPSSELGEEMSVAGWDDGDLEGLGAGISFPSSWHKCYGVRGGCVEGGTGKNEVGVGV